MFSRYYLRLLRYAVSARPRIFHILWNNKLELLDRTVLLLFYRLCGRRLAMTVHNVNIRKRDGNDSVLNRLSLRVQYGVMDHLFVHTERMKRELSDEFGVPPSRISVIPFGVNSTVPDTSLSGEAARAQLGLGADEQVVLFYGNIAPYKGLEYLIEAVALVAGQLPHLRLIVAGRPKGEEVYWARVEERVRALRDCRPTLTPHRVYPRRGDRDLLQGGRHTGAAVHPCVPERGALSRVQLRPAGYRLGRRFAQGRHS